MICAMVLPVFAAGLCLDVEPGAPWVRFRRPGGNPVFVDRTSVRDEAGLIRLAEVADGNPGKVMDIPQAERKPMKLDDPLSRRLLGFVCGGKNL